MMLLILKSSGKIRTNRPGTLTNLCSCTLNFMDRLVEKHGRPLGANPRAFLESCLGDKFSYSEALMSPGSMILKVPAQQVQAEKSHESQRKCAAQDEVSRTATQQQASVPEMDRIHIGERKAAGQDLSHRMFKPQQIEGLGPV